MINRWLPNEKGDERPVGQKNNITENPDLVNKNLMHLYSLVGEPTVLLVFNIRTKGPKAKDWQKTTYEQTQSVAYQKQLLRACRNGHGNIGALLGPSSGHLCAIDIDNDDQIAPFLDLNPKLKESLRTRGQKGCQVWVRIKGGAYPIKRIVSKLKNPGNNNKSIAEWRGGGGHQSVLRGIHPKGMAYQFIVEQPVVEVTFAEIIWPTHWEMKFGANGDGDSEPLPVVRDGELTELDGAQRQKVEEFIRTAKRAISGRGGSNPTLWVAVALSWEWALCRRLTIEFMHLYSATCCKPPWSEDEIERKVDSAFNRRHNQAFGCRWLPRFQLPHKGELASEAHQRVANVLLKQNASWFVRGNRLVTIEAVPTGFEYSAEPDEQFKVTSYSQGLSRLTAVKAKLGFEQYAMPYERSKDGRKIPTSLSSPFCQDLVQSPVLISRLRRINRILTVPLPMLPPGAKSLVYPTIGYNPRFGTWLVADAPALS